MNNNKLKQVKENLAEARSKGWWIACFYWERKLEQVKDNLLVSDSFAIKK